jgi:hypothetical protein
MAVIQEDLAHVHSFVGSEILAAVTMKSVLSSSVWWNVIRQAFTDVSE